MLRISLLLVFVVAGTTPVLGQSLASRSVSYAAAGESETRQPGPRIDLSAFQARRIAAFSHARDDSAGVPETGNHWAPALAIPGLSFGMAESDGGSRTAKAKHFAIIRLEGVSLLGGSIGGSVDGRSAHLVLSWHTDQ